MGPLKAARSSALDWTVNLAPIAGSLTLLHRRPEFRAAPATVSKMRELEAQGLVRFELGQPTGLKGADGKLEAVAVKRMDGSTGEIAADTLLPFFGLTMKLGPIANFGLNLNENLIPVDTRSSRPAPMPFSPSATSTPMPVS